MITDVNASRPFIPTDSRAQYVRRGTARSTIVQLICGVPQGSVLGRILFIVNSADLVSLIRQQCLSPNLYADDTQIYGASGPSDVGALLQKITGCLTAVADWMSANRLQLNSDKTEFMWLTSPRRQHRLPTSEHLIGSKVVSPSATVRDLGVFIDQDLAMKTHVQQTASRCFATLRQLRSIRRCIQTSVFNCLVSALVLSRLDYCNSLLIDLPFTHTRRLQSVQNAAARLIFTARCYASAVLTMSLCPSVCVCLSVTSRCSIKTAKRRITQTRPHDSAGTLVF